MAVVPNELAPEPTKERTRTNHKRTRKRARREKTASGDGIDRLREAADKRLAKSIKKIVDMLEGKVLDKEDLRSLGIWISLAARKKPRPAPVKKPRIWSLARQLEKEPEWKGPMAGDEEDRD